MLKTSAGPGTRGAAPWTPVGAASVRPPKAMAWTERVGGPLGAELTSRYERAVNGMTQRWLDAFRVADAGYFIWRGVHKFLTVPAVWLVPRVVPALPTTPLAPLIRAIVLPHLMVFGLILATLEVGAGALLLLNRWARGAAWILFVLNGTFFLTLGFKEPHDLGLNLFMGLVNLMFAWNGTRFRRAPARR
jgi:uncharacterized membrane protein YphA (DoxX/SURF4 family)